jgi:hypothetical protein
VPDMTRQRNEGRRSRGASVWDAASVRFWLGQKDNLVPVVGTSLAIAFPVDMNRPHQAPLGESDF